MKILVDKMIEALRRVGGGGGFESVLLELTEDDYDEMEMESQEVTREKVFTLLA